MSVSRHIINFKGYIFIGAKTKHENNLTYIKYTKRHQARKDPLIGGKPSIRIVKYIDIR